MMVTSNGCFGAWGKKIYVWKRKLLRTGDCWKLYWLSCWGKKRPRYTLCFWCLRVTHQKGKGEKHTPMLGLWFEIIFLLSIYGHPNRVKKPASQLFRWKGNRCLNFQHIFPPKWKRSKLSFKSLMLSSCYNCSLMVNFRNRFGFFIIIFPWHKWQIIKLNSSLKSLVFSLEV